MSDVQCMLQSELNLEEAQTEDNLKLFQPENRRFRDAIGVTGQSENSGQFSNVSQFNFGQRKFEVGMWLDIKDTIDQWLEAQITQVREDAIYVHYNGWGARWDEWININSPRIDIFRSHTVQNPKSNYLSPFPNILPESQRVPQQPYISHNLKDTINEACDITDKVVRQLHTFGTKRDEKEKLLKESETTQEEEKKDDQSDQRAR